MDGQGRGRSGFRGAPCVLALDVGTSSVRAGLYDERGEPLPGTETARSEVRWRVTPDGGMETDPDALFALVVRVVDAALEGVRATGADVAAVVVATFWHSLMGIGADGAPLTPLYGWGDSRAAGAALALRERLDEGAVHRRTGCFFHPSYPASRLLWLREAARDTFPRIAGWISFGEYLDLRFLGARRVSLSMASGTGLMELERPRWDPEVLAAVGVSPETLSPLVDTDAPSPPLLAEWARRWPELAGVPWLPPLGDGACANVGSGAVDGEHVALTVGTSAALRVLWETERVEVPRGLWCYRLDGRRLVMGRALSNGGNVAAHLRAQLRLPPPEETEAELAAMEPDAHGLTVVPSLLAERAPGWEAWAGAATVGATLRTRPVEVLRAWMEAVAHRLAGAHEALEAALGKHCHVVASGGALHASPAWARMVADALDRRVVLAAEREATARGAAVVALERLGWIPGLRAAAAVEGETFEPDPLRHARYRAARARQEALERATAPPARGGPDEARTTRPES